MKHTTIAVDIAKNVFELAVSHYPGQVAETHRLSRSRFLRFFAQREPADVVMEACGMAHCWARQIQHLGHDVVLLPPQYVRPYVRRNKTDRTDAKGLLEAHRNKDIHPRPHQVRRPADPRLPASLPLRLARYPHRSHQRRPRHPARARSLHPSRGQTRRPPCSLLHRRRRFGNSYRPAECSPPGL